MVPLIAALRAHVFAADQLRADDTPVPVLDPGRGKTKTGRLWACVRDGRPWGDSAPPAACYLYSPDRKGEHPREHLKEFRGVLHAAGHAGFSDLCRAKTPGTAPRIVEAACRAHVRRKFHDIAATVRGRPPEERRRVRQAEALPIVVALQAWLEGELAERPGKTATAQAIRLMRSRSRALSRRRLGRDRQRRRRARNQARGKR